MVMLKCKKDNTHTQKQNQSLHFTGTLYFFQTCKADSAEVISGPGITFPSADICWLCLTFLWVPLSQQLLDLFITHLCSAIQLMPPDLVFHINRRLDGKSAWRSAGVKSGGHLEGGARFNVVSIETHLFVLSFPHFNILDEILLFYLHHIFLYFPLLK